MSRTKINNIKRRIKHYESPMFSMLRDIVTIPSFSCQEEAVAQRILRELEGLAFDEAFVDEFGNVLGRIGQGERTILFDSHIDTVGVSDGAQWRFPPFEARISEGKLWGRGACDNKGTLVAQIYGAKVFQELLENPQDCSVYVLGSVQEEDFDGMAMEFALTRTLENVEAVVLGEPTGCQIHRGHRGRVELQITTEGKSCHASAPERGLNAVYLLNHIISELETLPASFKDHPVLGKGSLAVTAIESRSESLNTVPHRADLYLDRRLSLDETKETALKEISSLPSVIESAARVSVLHYTRPSWRKKLLPEEKYFPTWLLEETHPLMQKAVNAYTLLFNQKPGVGIWQFSTNGVASMGKLGIPTIGFGAGREEFSHSTDEHVFLEELQRAALFYALFPFVYFGLNL